MTQKSKFSFLFGAINRNQQIRDLRTFGDKVADTVTAWAGSTAFLVLNIIWFAVWIIINLGWLGNELVFDKYPFGFLTLVVSLEAIILSVFVLISQNRQSKRSELRSEMDYISDLQTNAEMAAVIAILERLAAKNDIDLMDLKDTLASEYIKIRKAHPLPPKD